MAKDIEEIYGTSEYMGSAETRKYMETGYAQLKAFLSDPDLVK